MTMTPLGGIISSAAGVPLSQAAGSEAERLRKDSAVQQRQIDMQQRAERAAGIGQTEQDQESSERDADGRRPWELSSRSANQPDNSASTDALARQSKDASGLSGTQLDLTG